MSEPASGRHPLASKLNTCRVCGEPAVPWDGSPGTLQQGLCSKPACRAALDTVVTAGTSPSAVPDCCIFCAQPATSLAEGFDGPDGPAVGLCDDPDCVEALDDLYDAYDARWGDAP